MRTGKTVLVTGATGRQGGAVVEHLITRGWPVRALTRNLERPPARALAQMGVEVVQGDLNDRGSLEAAVRGVYGVFGVQNFWEHGYEGEVRQGRNLADAARAAGVEHFVYSSVVGAERRTGIPHFESKGEIERYIQRLGLPTTVFRPVAFMENFLNPHVRSAILNGTLVYPLRPDRPLQMIAVDDIGAFSALAFENPKTFIGRTLEIAGDELTMPEAAEAFGRVIGRPVRFVQQSLEEVRAVSEEMAQMFRWLNEVGFRVDIPTLRSLYPGLMTFETWLRRAGWHRMVL